MGHANAVSEVLPGLDFEGLPASEQSGLLLQEVRGSQRGAGPFEEQSRSVLSLQVRAAMAQFASRRSPRDELCPRGPRAALLARFTSHRAGRSGSPAL